jgi:hypothetical protein
VQDQIDRITERTQALVAGQVAELTEALADGMARNGDATLTVKVKARKVKGETWLDCIGAVKSGATLKSAGESAVLQTGPMLPGIEEGARC